MNDARQSGSSEYGATPGKTRTFWHPLLAEMLAFTLEGGYQVQKEVTVGEPPLFVDILLIRQEGGELSGVKASKLGELLPLLNFFTLMEFKGPTDTLRWGDFSRLLCRVFLWYSRMSEPVGHDRISLMVVTPSVNDPLRDELRLLGCEISEHD